MNSPKQKVTIKLILQDEDGKDILTADLSQCGIQETYDINLNNEETCQSDLKKLFLKITELLFSYELSINFNEREDYPRKFIYDAMKSYAEDLDAEVKKTQTKIEQEYQRLK